MQLRRSSAKPPALSAAMARTVARSAATDGTCKAVLRREGTSAPSSGISKPRFRRGCAFSAGEALHAVSWRGVTSSTNTGNAIRALSWCRCPCGHLTDGGPLRESSLQGQKCNVQISIRGHRRLLRCDLKPSVPGAARDQRVGAGAKVAQRVHHVGLLREVADLRYTEHRIDVAAAKLLFTLTLQQR